jgi:serine/threonine protein kinase
MAASQLDGAVRQFRQEARMLNELHHSNLPRVHDFFEVDGKYYLVMDYVDGVTLEDLVQPAPIDEARVLSWAEQLCSVLGYLHGHNPPIIFRDLKPANIMVSSDGQIKLIDFGIAKNFDTRTGLGTQTFVRGAGTPGFAAPEQYGTGSDHQADIYSLGATLYCLLTRTIPPDATNIASGVEALTPLLALCPTLRPETAQTIETMMSLSKQNRPGSMAEAATMLGFSRGNDTQQFQTPTDNSTQPIRRPCTRAYRLVLPERRNDVCHQSTGHGCGRRRHATQRPQTAASRAPPAIAPSPPLEGRCARRIRFMGDTTAGMADHRTLYPAASRR